MITALRRAGALMEPTAEAYRGNAELPTSLASENAYVDETLEKRRELFAYARPTRDDSQKFSTPDANSDPVGTSETARAGAVSSAKAEVQAEWSGYVEEVHAEAGFFTATLIGVRGNGVKGERDDATIPISDVNKADMELLQPGGFFRLCVIYIVDDYGQPSRYTRVIFRRLPAYRQADLDAAKERGHQLARGLRVG